MASATPSPSASRSFECLEFFALPRLRRCFSPPLHREASLAEAQQANANLTPAQQIVSRYLLASANTPSGLQIAQVSPFSNVLVAAFAQSPSDVQKVIDRARLDGLEEDFRKAESRGQVELQVSLYRDAAGAAADVANPTLLAGLFATPLHGPSVGNHERRLLHKEHESRSVNLVFSSGRVEVLVSEIGRAGTVSIDDIVPLAQLMESRTKLQPPSPTPEELAVLATQTSPEMILNDAYGLLIRKLFGQADAEPASKCSLERRGRVAE